MALQINSSVPQTQYEKLQEMFNKLEHELQKQKELFLDKIKDNEQHKDLIINYQSYDTIITNLKNIATITN